MRSKAIVGGLIAGIVLVGVALVRGQVQPMPGPGSGIVTVRGTVDVGNDVISVAAAQRGDWKVSLADNRVVATLPPYAFLQAGGRYEVAWASGEIDAIRVAELGSRGWVRVENADGRRRWVNLDNARRVDELR